MKIHSREKRLKQHLIGNSLSEKTDISKCILYIHGQMGQNPVQIAGDKKPKVLWDNFSGKVNPVVEEILL